MGEPRLFRVIVLGGVSLIGAATAIVSCGSTGTPPPVQDAEADHDFPSELPVYVDSGVDASDAPDGAPVDAGKGDGFPAEGPPP